MSGLLLLDGHRSDTALACLAGTLSNPVVTLTFGFEATHPVTGQPLREWVRTVGDGRWLPGDRAWEFATLLDAENLLSAAGFEVLDPAGLPGDLTDASRPLISHTGDQQASVDVRSFALYPRLAGRAAIESAVPDRAVWDVRLGRWVIDAGDLDTVRDSLRRSAVQCGGLAPIDLLPPRLANIPAMPQGPDPSPAAPTDDSLRFDGTVDGLRGVPLSDLQAVGPVLSACMGGMGVASAYDLLHTLPRRFIDRTNPVPVTSASVGDKVVVIGTVVDVTPPAKVTKGRGMTLVKILDDADGKTKVTCRWFNQTWVARRFRVGMKLLVAGVLDQWVSPSGVTVWQINAPLADNLSGDDASDADARIIGVYPASATHNVTTWQMRAAAKEAVRRLPAQMIDPVPGAILTARNLVGRREALAGAHNPHDLEHAARCRDRLAYDELLRMQLVLAGRANDSVPGVSHPVNESLAQSLIGRLPYQLTGVQHRAMDAIRSDLRGGTPMNRLLQGEVGSGKTLVASLAMLDAVSAGSQAALMAPTESLAAQHFSDIEAMCSGLTKPDGSPVRVGMLTTKVTGKARKQVLAGLADGSVDIVIGTSALVADKTVYHRLGLVVIDEQHRFGVEQRSDLAAKSEHLGFAPDVLVMTATPVPRTALLTSFGDLDTSILNELPPGRSPITTRVIKAGDLDNADGVTWSLIRAQVAQGHQAFVVAPLVGESELKTARGAQALAEQAAAKLPGLRIGLAHGKQTPVERGEVMAAFKAGELDVLVATTVIEVGVNVPNATVIVVTGAEHFGIAQLHQLRGRVGRGQWPGTAVLVPSKDRADLAESAIARLEALRDCSDGFELSEIDLRNRGVGSLLSGKQSGTSTDLRVADLLADTELIVAAREDARAILAGDPTLARSANLRHEIAALLDTDAARWLGTL